jgi:hypothetical protein
VLDMWEIDDIIPMWVVARKLATSR